MSDAIKGFRGEYAWLSNFYPVPHLVYGYPTVEHYFQAMKTTDQEERHQIRIAGTPAQAKRLGRRVHLRPGWNAMRLEIMRVGLEAKFAPETELREWLLATGDRYLEETNTWNDTYWGFSNGRGLNHLGRLLMEIREKIQRR